MWLFLGTEVLLFAGLFLGYTVYRHFYHEAFHDGLAHARPLLGATNTVVLITSSLTVALAYQAVKQGKNKQCVGAAGRSRSCAPASSSCIKAFEYNAQVRGGRAARAVLSLRGDHAGPGANLYFTIYFLATGLHAFHVIVGMSVLIWVLVRMHQGALTRPTTTSPSSWAASTGTSSTWSGSSCSRSST